MKKTVEKMLEECNNYMSNYWTTVQIEQFHDIMRIWRWIIGFNLSQISEKIEAIQTNMPLIELMQNEGGQIPSPQEIEDMIQKYLSHMRQEIPSLFEKPWNKFLLRSSISHEGLRGVVGYIDNQSTRILDGWNDEYFQIFGSIH